MQSKNKTAVEKQWLTDVSDFASESDWLRGMYGHVCQLPKAFHIDHILGAQAKRKIDGLTVKVGEFAIMPLPIELHCITSNHRLNRTLKPADYRFAFGHEKQVWLKMINAMKRDGYYLPFDDKVINAIIG